MSIAFKCKMCGGNLEITENSTVCECEYCGAKQTLPKLSDDRRANLYDRANHFRRNNDYDKAMGIYEQILNDDGTDAEAYWSLVLCRFGIEYVEDPSTHKRVPTVNRAQFTSVFDDADYKSAIEYADDAQREVYKSEAEAINDIQKGILEISNKEEPFDVFICYKETDNNGRRTPDSVLANELYHQLTQEGFKVFFARITLEDKLGSAYEPYIFAALNSAKVMVVLGTKPEYFNAVWVKNEWSRYLSLIKSGAKKMLIPAYKDMDPYDLPDEFSHLQAQDMTKLGFMQDLIRGIKKITAADESPVVNQETVIVQSQGNANITALLKRAKMALEDKEFNKVDDFCEQVLNQDAEISEAYLYKLMATLEVSEKDKLRDCAQPFDNDNNYKKAYRYGSAELQSKLEEDNQYIRDRNENARREEIYCIACKMFENVSGADDCLKAKRRFESICEYKDSDNKAKECEEKAEVYRKDGIYSEACWLISNNTRESLSKAIKELESISDWKDSSEQIIQCKHKIEEIAEDDRIKAEQAAQAKAAADQRARKQRKILTLSTVSAIAIISGAIIINNVIIPEIKYNNAISLMESGLYDDAINICEEIGGRKDVSTILKECEYQKVLIGDFKKGDVITFGKINWDVLEKNDHSALLITDEIIEEKTYHEKNEATTWETSDLRKYLNEVFYEEFSDTEKTMISEINIKNQNNTEYNTNGGNDTVDKIFLLSLDDVNNYFMSDNDRVANINGCAWWWWLRSPGCEQDTAAIVTPKGKINTKVNVNSNKIGVRPAIWIEF